MSEREVEAVIAEHPAIGEVTVTGSHAAVSFTDDDVVSWAELIAYCRERLPPAQVPVSFEIMPST